MYTYIYMYTYTYIYLYMYMQSFRSNWYRVLLSCASPDNGRRCRQIKRLDIYRLEENSMRVLEFHRHPKDVL